MRTRRAQSGFTMTDLILSSLLVSIIVIAVAPIFAGAVASYALASQRMRVVGDTRNALMQMEREIIGLTSNTLTGIAATQISFTDINGAATDYHLVAGNPGSVQRGNAVVLPSATALTFTYYDGNGVITNVIANVRRIGIQITGSTANQGSLTLRSIVFPRNFLYSNFQ